MSDKSVSQSERTDIQHLAYATGALNGMVRHLAKEVRALNEVVRETLDNEEIPNSTRSRLDAIDRECQRIVDGTEARRDSFNRLIGGLTASSES